MHARPTQPEGLAIQNVIPRLSNRGYLKLGVAFLVAAGLSLVPVIVGAFQRRKASPVDGILVITIPVFLCLSAVGISYVVFALAYTLRDRRKQ